ncbi:MAG: 16S rRNA (cytidine(1402)-2'-O)-methyltransferase [Eubacteriales bacterium]|nr:16S rRNA (cytidine(1402)-2'-O)-methyltransferase [Eubacteriales bacterium]
MKDRRDNYENGAERSAAQAAAQKAVKGAENRCGKLYICATPIGNLEDITPRVLRALSEADLIAAEDTRNSIKLLNHFEIKTPMTSYHEYNRFEKADELVAKMLSGKNVAIITDAGTPCISDPGEVLVQKCAQAGIEITSLPGASAVITALTLSGLSTRRFVFEGFLPPKKEKKERQAVLGSLRDETRTIVLYEAPHHLRETLSELSDVLGGERRISLCRELTKRYEEVIRTTLSEAAATVPKGEYVLVIEGRSREELLQRQRESFETLSIEEHVQQYMDAGMDKKEAMKAAAKDRGVSRRDIYQALFNQER